MSKVNALVQISVPGFTRRWVDKDFLDYNTCLEDDPAIKWLLTLVTKAGLEWNKCDTIAGWGCLNQDWIEFTCDIETSWSWCKPCFIVDGSDAEKYFFELLDHGKLIMMVHYVEDGKYIPHH